MDESKCPECEGEGGYQRIVHTHPCGAFVGDEENERFHVNYCTDEWATCRVCRGSGSLDGVELAVYRARGGAPLIQTQGWS